MALPKLVLLILITVVVFVTLTNGDETPLERIMLEHFDKLQNSDLAKRLMAKKRNAGAFDDAVPRVRRFAHKCEHDHLRHRLGHTERYSESSRQKLRDTHVGVPLEVLQKKRFVLLANETEPIRVYADTSLLSTSDSGSCLSSGSVVTLDDGTSWNCRPQDVLSADKVSLFNDHVIPTIMSMVKSMILLNPVVGNLLADSTFKQLYGGNCRQNLAIPSFLFSTGQPNADYYAIFTARPIASDSVLANALPCNHNVFPNGYFGRPLVGSIDFNPGSTDTTTLLSNINDQWMFNRVVMTGLHEMTHALGFTSDLYKDYQTPNGALYLGGPTVNGTYSGLPTILMATPRVKSFSQTHFNCSSLRGMELENYQANGGAGSHWEDRLVPPEYMTGIASSQDQVVSGLTLALFEDMGWYKVNYSSAKPMRWGLNAGCAFATQPCSSATWGRYFCTDTTQTKRYCTGERDAMGYCDVSQYSGELPVQYQYFPGQPTLGGSDWMDYCPAVTGYSNTYCNDVLRVSQASNTVGMTYGSNSMCFDTATSSGKTSAACYNVICAIDPETNNTVAKISVGSQYYTCDDSKSSFTPSSLNIVVSCPPLYILCPSGFGSAVPFVWNATGDQPFGSAPPAGTSTPRTTFQFPDLPWGNTTLGSFFNPSSASSLLGSISPLVMWILVGIGGCLVLVICVGILGKCMRG